MWGFRGLQKAILISRRKKNDKLISKATECNNSGAGSLLVVGCLFPLETCGNIQDLLSVPYTCSWQSHFKGTHYGTLIVGRTDILQEWGTVWWGEKWRSYETTQLQQLTRYGMSSKDHKWARIRCVADQCATGTVSIHILRHMLGVSESIWPCPKCSYVDSWLQ